MQALKTETFQAKIPSSGIGIVEGRAAAEKRTETVAETSATRYNMLA